MRQGIRSAFDVDYERRRDDVPPTLPPRTVHFRRRTIHRNRSFIWPAAFFLFGALYPGVAAAWSSMSNHDVDNLVFAAEKGHLRADDAPSADREGEQMQITFTRSGGFAGPATSCEGSITFDGISARVTSSFGYRRDLAPDEIQMLRAAISQLPSAQVPSPGQLRDAYQYDIRIARDDGTTENLTVHGDPQSGPQDLFGWVRQECDRIWAHRANSRSR